jgi:predicted metal-dependent hydrolase
MNSAGAMQLSVGRDRTVAVTVRRSARAQRLILRLDQTGTVTLVLPPGVREAEAQAFLKAHTGWLDSRMAKVPEKLTFAPGATVPYRGVEHTVRHRSIGESRGRRGVVWLEPREEGPELHIAGPSEHLPRRLTDWLKAEARRELATRSRHYAAELGRQIGRVTVRDTRSRWGSCSSKGDLSFCWRLILAPDFVIDYVVAHEAAHLVEMNHSIRFWRLVDQLGVDRQRAQRWLKANGPRLHRYG